MGEPQRSHINWAELDRLVDGQLNREEYREMLRQIDKDPDGWRQCAMAFLEHQAMEKELAAFGVSDDCPAGLRSGEYVASGDAAVPGFGSLFRNVVMLVGLVLVMIGGIAAGSAFRSAPGDPPPTSGSGQPGLFGVSSPSTPAGSDGEAKSLDGESESRDEGCESKSPCSGTRTHRPFPEDIDGIFDGDESLQGCRRCPRKW